MPPPRASGIPGNCLDRLGQSEPGPGRIRGRTIQPRASVSRDLGGGLLDVKLTEGPEAFDLPEWPVLLERDPYRHIFATPEWSRVWWEEFGAGRRLLVLSFCDPDPVGLAPLVLDPEAAVLSFLGGDDLTDYMGPISVGHESQRAIADTLLGYALEDIPSWCSFDARCPPVPFGFAEWLRRAAAPRGAPL